MGKSKNETIGIIGLGRFGMSLAFELARSGKDIICIDKDEKKIKQAHQFTDFAYVSEDLSLETLEETGFKECETVVVCIGEKIDVSILTTLNVISLGINKVIAKAGSEEQGKVLERLGAEVIFPDRDSAYRLAKRITSKNVLDFISLNDNIEVSKLTIPLRYVGKKILDTDIRNNFKLNIIAIDDNHNININISPDYAFKKSDKIIVIGAKKDINNFEEA